MNHIFRNTAAVLVLTLFTGLAVFSAIQLGDRLFGTADAGAQTVTAASAAATEDGRTGGESGVSGYDQGADAYGYDQDSGAGSSTGTTQTCPATGCSASSCHATE